MVTARIRRAAPVAALAVTALLATGCTTSPRQHTSAPAASLNVLMVGNSQMTDIAKLTAGTFTKSTGITVHFTELDENTLRAKVQDDVANQTGAFDVVTLGAYEVPIWSKNGWLRSLSNYARADRAFDSADILTPMKTAVTGWDGKLYGVPFYGESSMLMYRKDLLAAHHLTMPVHPTWKQVAAVAARLTDRKHAVAGICLRGLPGWGEVLAPLTTVVNTFGGTWFDAGWNAQLTAPAFGSAVNFYTSLVKKYGEKDPQRTGFTECQDAMATGKAAMWYDATSGAGRLEDPTQSVAAGELGYAFAPVEKTRYSGWLWSWNWAMPATTKQPTAAWKFISWASSKKYEALVGRRLGWSRVPDGKRASTYLLAPYRRATAAYADVAEQSIAHADPRNPGVQKRPTLGIQFVDVAEFAQLGDTVSDQLAQVFTGKLTAATALARGQRSAAAVASLYRHG